MKILNKKVWKCLQERKVVDLSLLIPATPPEVIEEVVYIGQVLPATINILITKDMLIEVDLGNKIPATLPLAIGEQEL